MYGTAEKHSPSKLEEACSRALSYSRTSSYKSIKNLLVATKEDSDPVFQNSDSISSIAVLKITAHNHTHENIPYNPTHGSPQMLLQRPLIKALLHGLFVFSYMP